MAFNSSSFVVIVLPPVMDSFPSRTSVSSLGNANGSGSPVNNNELHSLYSRRGTSLSVTSRYSAQRMAKARISETVPFANCRTTSRLSISLCVNKSSISAAAAAASARYCALLCAATLASRLKAASQSSCLCCSYRVSLSLRFTRITSRSRSTVRKRSATLCSCFDFTASVSRSSSSRLRASAVSPAISRSEASFLLRRSRSARVASSSWRLLLILLIVFSPSIRSTRISGNVLRMFCKCEAGSTPVVTRFEISITDLSDPETDPPLRLKFRSNASMPERASWPSK